MESRFTGPRWSLWLVTRMTDMPLLPDLLDDLLKIVGFWILHWRKLLVTLRAPSAKAAAQ